MTLNANEPTDQRGVNELASYIREDRAVINSMSIAGDPGDVGVTDLTVNIGTTLLTIGTDVGAYGYEVVKVTGSGVSTLTGIIGGTEGQVKLLVFQDTNVRITDGNVKSTGLFYLNQLPAGGDFNPQQDDVIWFVNVDGNGGAINGYWKEVNRTISLK